MYHLALSGSTTHQVFSREIPFNGYEAADVREAVVGGGRPKVSFFQGPTQLYGHNFCRMRWPSQLLWRYYFWDPGIAT